MNANDLSGLNASSIDEQTTDQMPSLDTSTPVTDADETPPKKRIKKRYICFALIALTILGVGVAWAATNGFQQPEKPDDPIVVEDDNDKSDYTPQIALHVKAEGFSDTSTPVIAHIEGGKDNAVNVYHAFAANEDHAIDVDPGNYTVTYISPINADGSIYKVSEPIEASVPEDNSDLAWMTQDGRRLDDEATFEKIPADQVTQEQIDAILTNIKEAVSKGDETLAGQAGQKVVDTAASNAAAAPNVDKEKVEAQAEEAKQNVSEAPTATTTNPSSNNAPAPSNSSQSNAPSGGNTSNGNSTGGSTPSVPTPVPDPTPEPPAHVHNKVAVTHQVEKYEQQWVSNWVTKYFYTCSYCGTHTYSYEEADAHQTQEALALGTMYSFYSDSSSSDEGSYKNVFVGYDDVIDGYKCSGCGISM